MSEWKEYKLGDIVSEVIDNRGKTPLKLGGDWAESGYRALSAKNVKTGVIINEDSIRFVDEELYKKWMKSEIEKGNILVTSEAPFGQVYYWNSNEKIVLSQRLFGLKIKDSYDSKFIYYQMIDSKFQNEMDKRATGSTVVGLRQPELLSCLLDIPNITTQKKIAAVLSSLDDKIETNRTINARLEELASAFFKSWFIDFEPFADDEFVEDEDGRRPEGWEIKSLSNIANYTNGLAMQKYPPISDTDKLPVLKIKELGQGFCSNDSDFCSDQTIGEVYHIKDGDVIFSWSGTLMVKIWTGGDCGLNQHLFKVTSTDYPKWFIYLWTKHHNDNFINIARDKAVTMGHIKRGELDKALALIPPKNVLKTIDGVLSPIIDEYITRSLEITRLASLRDTLLPRLMSGELIPE